MLIPSYYNAYCVTVLKCFICKILQDILAACKPTLKEFILIFPKLLLILQELYIHCVMVCWLHSIYFKVRWPACRGLQHGIWKASFLKSVYLVQTNPSSAIWFDLTLLTFQYWKTFFFHPSLLETVRFYVLPFLFCAFLKTVYYPVRELKCVFCITISSQRMFASIVM